MTEVDQLSICQMLDNNYICFSESDSGSQDEFTPITHFPHGIGNTPAKAIAAYAEALEDV